MRALRSGSILRPGGWAVLAALALLLGCAASPVALAHPLDESNVYHIAVPSLVASHVIEIRI